MRQSRATHDPAILAAKLHTGGLLSLTRGERIAAAKIGLVPPVRSERERQLRSRYGLTLEDYDALLLSQGGVCAACQQEWHAYFYVDHDHETGRVRGLLCAARNTLVGLLESGTARVENCFNYLHGLGTDDRYRKPEEDAA